MRLSSKSASGLATLVATSCSLLLVLLLVSSVTCEDERLRQNNQLDTHHHHQQLATRARSLETAPSTSNRRQQRHQFINYGHLDDRHMNTVARSLGGASPGRLSRARRLKLSKARALASFVRSRSRSISTGPLRRQRRAAAAAGPGDEMGESNEEFDELISEEGQRGHDTKPLMSSARSPDGGADLLQLAPLQPRAACRCPPNAPIQLNSTAPTPPTQAHGDSGNGLPFLGLGQQRQAVQAGSEDKQLELKGLSVGFGPLKLFNVNETLEETNTKKLEGKNEQSKVLLPAKQVVDSKLAGQPPAQQHSAPTVATNQRQPKQQQAKPSLGLRAPSLKELGQQTQTPARVGSTPSESAASQISTKPSEQKLANEEEQEEEEEEEEEEQEQEQKAKARAKTPSLLESPASSISYSVDKAKQAFTSNSSTNGQPESSDLQELYPNSTSVSAPVARVPSKDELQQEDPSASPSTSNPGSKQQQQQELAPSSGGDPKSELISKPTGKKIKAMKGPLENPRHKGPHVKHSSLGHKEPGPAHEQEPEAQSKAAVHAKVPTVQQEEEAQAQAQSPSPSPSPSHEALAPKCRGKLRELSQTLSEVRNVVNQLGRKVVADESIERLKRDSLSRRVARIRAAAEEAQVAANSAKLRLLNEAAKVSGIELIRLGNLKAALKLEPSLKKLGAKLRRAYGLYRKSCRGAAPAAN